MMDYYYQQTSTSKPLEDFQLTAVTAFFISAKNVMVEPFSLDDAKTILCNNEYSERQFLEKERELRSLVGYRNEICSHSDFCQLFLKATKAQFIQTYSRSGESRRKDSVIEGTRRFFDEWE